MRTDITYDIMRPTTSLIVPWSVIPTNIRIKLLDPSSVPQWWREQFETVQAMIPDVVMCAPVFATETVWVIRKSELKEFQKNSIVEELK